MPFTPDSAPTSGFVPDKPSGFQPDSPAQGGLLGLLKGATGAMNAFDHGMMQAGTLGYGDAALKAAASAVGKGDQADAFMKQTDQEHPWARTAGDIGGAIGVGGVTGAGVGAATEALGLTGSGVLPALGRIGVNTAAGATQGAATNPGDGGSRTTNAALGGLLMGGGSALGELVSAATGPAARVKQQISAQSDPEAYSELARNKIGETRDALLDSTKQRAQTLHDLLDGKQVDVGSGPPLDANDANAAKKMYDGLARRPQGAMWSTGEAAKAQEFGDQADKLRSAIEAVEPQAADINSEMQREIKLRSYLGKGAQRAPIQTLATSSADKQALLSEAARRAGTDIDSFGADSRLAKSLTFGPGDLNHMGIGTLVKGAGRLGVEGLSRADVPAQLLKDPTALSALLASLQTQK